MSVVSTSSLAGLSMLLAVSTIEAQSRVRHQTKTTQIDVRQTASKDCVSADESEGCYLDTLAPEPKTTHCSDCIIFGKPITRPAPCYPALAKAKSISRKVRVEVEVDEEGKVIWAKAISGDPILQPAAIRAACRSRFTPSRLIGSKTRVKAVGSLTYDFKL